MRSRLDGRRAVRLGPRLRGLRRTRAWAAKRKQPPRFVDGESAHARLPGAGCALLRVSEAQSIFSLDAALQDLVTAQQPWVAPQLPAGGDVSLSFRCKAPRSSDAGFVTVAVEKHGSGATTPERVVRVRSRTWSQTPGTRARLRPDPPGTHPSRGIGYGHSAN